MRTWDEWSDRGTILTVTLTNYREKYLIKKIAMLIYICAVLM